MVTFSRLALLLLKGLQSTIAKSLANKFANHSIFVIISNLEKHSPTKVFKVLSIKFPFPFLSCHWKRNFKQTRLSLAMNRLSNYLNVRNFHRKKISRIRIRVLSPRYIINIEMHHILTLLLRL